MLSTEPPEAREIKGVTILGPDLFAKDHEGKPLSPVASIFPRYRAFVAGRGIHAMQAAMMVEFLRKKLLETEGRDLGHEEEEVYQNAVALFIRNSTILIRSDPENMDRCFAADDLLQRLVPKERIQFTGIHLAEVRKKIRWRGESWRISPLPHSVKEIGQYLQSSRVQVNTGTTFYLNAHTGERFLTYGQFVRIRPLLRENGKEALARLKEIVHLSPLVNDQGFHELRFFLPPEKELGIGPLGRLISVLESTILCEGDCRSSELGKAERLFDHFAASFADAAGPELTAEDENYVTWQTAMFCRLYEISEKVVEERTLGLSPEFHLNVRWLPGARIVDGELFFEPNVEWRARGLIAHYWQTWSEIVSINIGRVETSQTTRDRTGEQREVYLVVLGRADGGEDIRLVRMMKWDVMHRLRQGNPKDQAVGETIQYRDYIFDRLRAIAELGVPTPIFNEIQLEEEVPSLGKIPVFFVDRQYVPGIVTDKIPPGQYAQKGFVIRLAHLLGQAAGASLVLGRACNRTGNVFFDDGDEVIQLDDECLPECLIICETTGSFTDWSTPIPVMVPHYLWHLSKHLEKAREKGIQPEELKAAVHEFADSLVTEIARMQQFVSDPSSRAQTLFEDRSPDPGGIRSRWEGILKRLETTDTKELRRLVIESPHLAPFLVLRNEE
jgi:hypothetical protein